MKISAIVVAVVFVVGITMISLELRAVITTMYLFPLSVLGKSLNMSIATSPREPARGSSRSFRCFYLFRGFREHNMHLFAVLLTFLPVWCQ